MFGEGNAASARKIGNSWPILPWGVMSETAYIQGKRMKSLLLWVIVVISVFGCSRDQHDHPNLTTGEELFNFHCVECHGVQGAGNLLDGIPANILTSKSPQEIAEYITIGKQRNREMPVFSTMSADEAKVITEHLFRLKESYDKNGSQIRQLLIEP